MARPGTVRPRWSRRRRRIIRWGVVLALVIVAAWVAWDRWLKPKPLVPIHSVRIGQQVFNVELADDRKLRYRGLSDRRELAADGGMLFLFAVPHSPQRIPFVMRRCHINLDIAFISPERKIVTIHTMYVEPYGTPDDELKPYHATERFQFALEVNGGEFEKRGIGVGDEVHFSEAIERRIAKIQ